MILMAGVVVVVMIGLITWFHGLEGTNRRHVILVVLVVTMLVEAILAGRSSDVAVGLLRPRVGGQDFRPPDAVIVAAIAARILNGRPSKITSDVLAWGAFLAMYFTGVVYGLMSSIPTIDVLFQGKAMFYIVGGMVIGAGADFKRLNESIGKLGVFLAVLVPFAVAIEAVNFTIDFNLPGQKIRNLGRLSNDTVTLLVLFGVVVVLTEAMQRRPRTGVLFAGVVLLLAPIAGQQRGSYLVLLFTGAAIATVALTATWRRRTRVTPIEIGLGFSAILAAVVTGFIVTGSPGVIVAQVEDAFIGERESASAEARVLLYDQAVEKIQESPIIGSGVGTKVFRIRERGDVQIAAAAHNLVLDLGMRVGAIGVLLFTVAVFVSSRNGLWVWVRARNHAVAAIALSAVIIMLGVVAKGMIEPALEKYRLTLPLGLAIGLIIAARRITDEETSSFSMDDPESFKVQTAS